MVSSSIRSSLHVLCWWHLATCFAQDSITPLNPVRNNQTIISAGQSFALGFFSPGNSSNRYVGIWYSNIPGPTFVWVANREKPVRDSSGALAIAEDGNLVVLDGRNITLWTTNVFVPLASRENVSAVLLQSGNLVLKEGDETIIWQSFDFPSDTLLPGMKLSLNLRTRSTWRLRSWQDANDPAPGAFSLGIDPQGPLTQQIMWKGSDRYWRIAVWDGRKINGLAQSPNFIAYLTVIANDQEIYMTIALSDDSIQTRFVLIDSGQIQQFSWQNESRRWDLGWRSPSNNCILYNSCGPFGYCIDRGSEWDCSCLKGYVPENQEQWDKGNWSAGCVRKRVLDCVKGGDGFFKMEGMVLSDQPISLMESSMGECEARCQSNWSLCSVCVCQCE